MATRGLTRQKGNRNLLNVQYMKRIEDEMKGMIANFSQTFKQKGAICDSEGFYQHTGQCWSDAIQMIFIFSDGLKEVVQQKLATTLIDDTFMDHVDNNDIVSDPELSALSISEKNNLASSYKKSAIDYFTVVQHRFMRHYVTELQRRKIHETCSSNIPEERIYTRLLKVSGKLHVSGKNAIQAEKLAKVGKINNTVGGTRKDISYLLYLYSLTFFDKSLQFIMEIRNDEIIYECNALYLTIYKERTNKRHALCCYTCGGIDILYEDNFGPIPFNWKQLFTLYYEYEGSEMIFGSCMMKKEYTVYTSSYYPIVLKDSRYYSIANNDVVELEYNKEKDGYMYISEKIIIHTITNGELPKLHDVIGIRNRNDTETSNIGFDFSKGLRFHEMNVPRSFNLRSVMKERKTRKNRKN